jgi:putative selenium metabolism hydrolase
LDAPHSSGIQDLKKDLVPFAQELIRTPSLPGDEEKVADLVLARLQAGDVDESWVDEIGNVIGVMRGEGSGPNVLLNGHMDVVPPGQLEKWEHAPFAADIDSAGTLHGRGSADMKGGLASLVFAMLAMKELRDRGLKLTGDIIFSAVVHEETAGMLGMHYLCEHSLPARKLGFDVCYLAEPTNGRINLGHRGKVEILVRTRGKTAHSSSPWMGVNAIEKMVPVLEAVFQEIAPSLPSDPELGRSTITVTKVVCEPGALSIIPDLCEISVDRRYLPGETVEEILADFEAMFDRLRAKDPDFAASASVRTMMERSYTGLEREVQKQRPAWNVSKENAFVRETCNAMIDIGREPELGYFRGGVDGALTAGVMGVPTMGYSGADESLAHTEEEHTTVKTLVSDMEAYVAILTRLLGAAAA